MAADTNSDGANHERTVAAVLQAGGWFVIRGASDPSFRAFELDALGYRLSEGSEASVVVESKSGASGFGDFWKLLGLKSHLELERGVLLADPSDPLHEMKERLGRQHEISVVDQDILTIAKSFKKIKLVDRVVSDEMLAAWRHCYEVEDGLLRILYDKKLWQKYETIKLAKRQVQHLASNAWMQPDPWQQASDLYELYFDSTKIARELCKEINPKSPDGVFQDAMYDGKHEEVQACFYLEHRKRIAVAFAAVRCAALRPRPGMWAVGTPSNFKKLVKRVAEAQAWQLPNLLQLYFLGFGGMTCTDAKDAEFAEMARQVGCDAAEVADLLEMFDELFPYPHRGGSWFIERDELVRLKLMPVPLRGAGIRMREVIYEGEWKDIATPKQLRACGTQQKTHAERVARRK